MGKLKDKTTWLSGIVGAIIGAAITVAATFGIINPEQKVAMEQANIVLQDATVYSAGIIEEILSEANKIKGELPKADFEALQTAIKKKDFGAAQDCISKIATLSSKESVKVSIDVIKLKLGILKDIVTYTATKKYDAIKTLLAKEAK